MVYKKNYEKTEARDYQQELTDKFIARIEEAISCEEKGLKWEKPFLTCNEWPRNALSGEKYRGGNVATLMMAEYSDPRWLTFNQMQELSRQLDKPLKIIKNSKAEFIMKVVPTYQRGEDGNVVKDSNNMPIPVEDENGNKKIGFKFYAVFNASCVEGMEPYITPNKDVKPYMTVEMLSQALQERDGLKVEYSNRGAFYSPSQHLVNIPKIETFKSSEAYADTVLHEFGHATSKSLGRDLKGLSSDKISYSREELLAELTSCFMSVELGIPHNPANHENHAAYLKSWLSVLKDDKTFITKASAGASKATEFLVGHLEAYKLELEQKNTQSITPSETEDLAKEITKQLILKPKTEKLAMSM